MTDPSLARLSADSIAPSALAKLQTFHPEVVRNVKDAIEQHDVVVVGMAQNPHVRRVRRVLTAANIPFHYLEYGSYLSEWQPRLAIKMWSGWPTFPQVFVHGILLGGADLTAAALEDGSLPARLAEGRRKSAGKSAGTG